MKENLAIIVPIFKKSPNKLRDVSWSIYKWSYLRFVLEYYRKKKWEGRKMKKDSWNVVIIESGLNIYIGFIYVYKYWIICMYVYIQGIFWKYSIIKVCFNVKKKVIAG
jgi:hypothetical protein